MTLRRMRPPLDPADNRSTSHRAGHQRASLDVDQCRRAQTLVWLPGFDSGDG
jgi:hypothetical protein